MDIEKNKEIIKLRRMGWSWGAIAIAFNISKSRVHQIVSGYSSRNMKKIRKLLVALRGKCEVCGLQDDLVIHHINGDDRNNSMDNLAVFCRACHTSFHITKSFKFYNCKNCRKEFVEDKSKTYCCDKCKIEFYKVKKICEMCKKEYYVKRSSHAAKKSRWCSKLCQGKWLAKNYGFKNGWK
jgi:hypothetical protein